MNPLELGCSRFSCSFAVEFHTVANYTYLNFQDKNIKPPSNASPKFVVLAIFKFFDNIGWNPNTADDATMSSNFIIVPKWNEKLEESPLIWMFPNNHAKKNELERWCALKWLIPYGIIKCCLTLMFLPST